MVGCAPYWPILTCEIPHFLVAGLLFVILYVTLRIISVLDLNVWTVFLMNLSVASFLLDCQIIKHSCHSLIVPFLVEEYIERVNDLTKNLLPDGIKNFEWNQILYFFGLFNFKICIEMKALSQSKRRESRRKQGFHMEKTCNWG